VAIKKLRLVYAAALELAYYLKANEEVSQLNEMKATFLAALEDLKCSE